MFKSTLIYFSLLAGLALILVGLITFSGYSPVALAQSAAPDPTQPQLTPGQTFMRMVPMLGIVFIIFYFMVIRPQDKKLREHRSLLESLKKGQHVITSGGLLGKVAGVEKDFVMLEIANNVRVKVEPTHILKSYERKGEEAAA